MTVDVRGATVRTVMTGLGPDARLLVGSEADLEQPVSGASVVTTSNEVAPGSDVALIITRDEDDHLAHVVAALDAADRRVLVVTHAIALEESELRDLAGPHLMIEAPDADPADVVVACMSGRVLPQDTTTRRLTGLQRSLTQVFGEPQPLQALLSRLASTCNATAALVDNQGRPVHSTGPLPLAAVFDAIGNTTAETQHIDVDGWTGVADRIHDVTHQGSYFGWLVITSRRPGFPESYDTAAAHVAAALIEAIQRMTTVTRQQERAVRAAVLEEALAHVPVPANPELSGRIASLGLTWSEEIRATVVQPVRSTKNRGKPALEESVRSLSRALDDGGVAHLVSVRERFAVLLVQGSSATIRRSAVAAGQAMSGTHLGVGRRVASLTDVAASFHDAQLAVETLRRTGRRAGLMTYEDFDFATRLFSDVGVSRMTLWARDFLAPLHDRDPLLEGLQEFFRHGQNMNAAAEALNIHHNSLRYRLAKVEELLEVSLRDPAAIASVFLALSALELERVNAPARRGAGSTSRQPGDVEAPRSVRDTTPPPVDNLGVVFGPDRR